MRRPYLGQDRAAIHAATTCQAQRLKDPSEYDMEELSLCHQVPADSSKSRAEVPRASPAEGAGCAGVAGDVDDNLSKK